MTDRVRQYPAGFWDLYFLILLTHERLQASQTTRTMEVDRRGRGHPQGLLIPSPQFVTAVT